MRILDTCIKGIIGIWISESISWEEAVSPVPMIRTQELAQLGFEADDSQPRGHGFESLAVLNT